jgi:hypothetical protein
MLVSTREHSQGHPQLVPEFVLMQIWDFEIICALLMILDKSFASCVILGKLIALSEPHCFQLLSRDNNITVKGWDCREVQTECGTCLTNHNYF